MTDDRTDPRRAFEDDFVGLAAATRITRRRDGLSRAEIARRSGLSTKFIGAVETRTANPTLSRLIKLAKGLGLRNATELLDIADAEARKLSNAQRQEPEES